MSEKTFGGDLWGDDSIESSLQKAIDEDVAEKTREKKVEKKKSGDNKKRNVAVVSGLAVLLAGLGVSGALLVGGGEKGPQNGTGGPTEGDDKTSSVSVKVDEEPEAELVDTFYLEEDVVEMADWQKQTFSDVSPEEGVVDEEFRNSVINEITGGSVWSGAGTLPSEAGGVTSDLSQTTNEDGTLNTFFSYWTQEVFSYELYTKVERLLNPRFGGWSSYQYAGYNANSEFNFGGLRDMFTDEFIESHTGQPYGQWVPIYADWNSDNYGMGEVLLESGPRWFGEVTADTINFNYDMNTLQYTASYEADVKFSAWTKDQEKVEKTGKLTMKLVSGASKGMDKQNRVLINDAQLVVN